MRTPKPNPRTARRRAARRRADCRRALRRPPRLQRLEDRMLLAGGSIGEGPLGATPLDTGEFLLGRVAVTPVLFESNGEIDPQTQNWSTTEVRSTLLDVAEGVNWWRDTLDGLQSVHSLEFVIDETFAIDETLGTVTAVETPYEPIDRPSEFFETYVGQFLTDQGYGGAGSVENAIRLFNHDQRIAMDADWAFTIFIVDASNDQDGFFPDTGDFRSAFAFAGGQFIVMPSSRPPQTIAHEMGHIFWARDEYSGGGSYTDRRGYYNAQNLNAANNPNHAQEPSIMRGGTPLDLAYNGNFSPESTLAMVGWQDTDGDGVFDVADVPLRLDAVGSFDHETSTYRLEGTASAVPLRNQNSAGLQSDITLNRVSQIQYSLDQGPWITAASPDQQVVDLEVQVTINQIFDSIRWRAIDQTIGITSNIIHGSDLIPAVTSASLAGFAFVDQNDNRNRESEELPLAGALVSITTAEGESLPSGSIVASDYGDGEIPDVIDGASVYSDGVLVAAEVASFGVSAVGDARVFHSFNRQSNRYTYLWSDRAAFVANFESPVSRVQADIIGFGDGSYGRLEAYDAAGNLIGRVTSGLVANQQTETIEFTDPSAAIAGIRFFGHGQTHVALAGVRFDINAETVTDQNGAWRLPNLPAGDYRLTLQPRELIYQFNDPTIDVQVTGNDGPVFSAAALRVTNPRHNADIAADVNDDGELTAQDAFIIINDLNLNEARVLGHDESVGDLIDVNDDGSVTSLDALRVINALSRQSVSGGESAYYEPAPSGPDVSPVAADASQPLAPVSIAAQRIEAQGVEAQGVEAQGVEAQGVDSVLAQWPHQWRPQQWPTGESSQWLRQQPTTGISPNHWGSLDGENPADYETDSAGPGHPNADSSYATNVYDKAEITADFGGISPLKDQIEAQNLDLNRPNSWEETADSLLKS